MENLLTKEELRALTKKREGPFISIFIPTQQIGPETRKNPIRLKNMVSEAEERLIDYGVRAVQARSLLEPVKDLIDDYSFWQHQRKGLAIYLTADMFRAYQVPLSLDELIVVADRFHLKPLMPLLSDDGRFYILALSQNEIRLFQASHYTIDEIELEDVPKSMAEALQYDDPQKQQQFHTATDTSGTAANRPAMFHGHGVGSDNEKQNILRFFQHVDRGLQALLQNEQAPLVLAGVAYLFPIYQEANGYQYLVEEGITGNPENMQAKDLHRQGWKIVQSRFQQARQEAEAKYKQFADTDQASKDIRKIVPAACYGQVSTLFVPVGQQQWGVFDPDSNTIEIHDETKPGDEDLLDLAAVQTFLHGGTVYTIESDEPENLPDNDTPTAEGTKSAQETTLAAIFRY